MDGKLWTLPAHREADAATVMVPFQRTLTVERWQAVGARRDGEAGSQNICKRIRHIRHSLEVEPRDMVDIDGRTFHDGDTLMFDLEDPGADSVGVMLFAREPPRERNELFKVSTIAAGDGRKLIVELSRALQDCEAKELGIVLADVVRNANEAFGWDMDEIVAAMEREIEEPTSTLDTIERH